MPFLACLKKLSKIQMCFSRRASADLPTTNIRLECKDSWKKKLVNTNTWGVFVSGRSGDQINLCVILRCSPLIGVILQSFALIGCLVAVTLRYFPLSWDRKGFHSFAPNIFWGGHVLCGKQNRN